MSDSGQPIKAIVLIDDEPGVLFALRLLLESLGYKVKGFTIAAEALEFLKTESECDLVICDLKMPKINGLAALKESKRIRPKAPFVLMSAHATNEEIETAKADGAAGFLAKPFTPEELNALVAEVAAGVGKINKA